MKMLFLLREYSNDSFLRWILGIKFIKMVKSIELMFYIHIHSYLT